MGYAFISYSSKNESFANSINKLFKQNGINTWMAPNDIPIGSKYAEIITPALRECSCLVLLLSNDAQASTWVPKEVERAINYKKSIFPIQLEDVTLNAEFELYISTSQIVAFNKIDEDSAQVRKILETIRTCVNGSESLPTPSDIPFHAHRLAIGDVIDGKYLVTNHLFSYRDSDMYITKQINSETKFFLKVFYKNSATFDTQQFCAIFSSLRGVSSPHLSEIIDLVEREDALFIVHKYREYTLLKDLISTKTIFPDSILLDIAIQLCEIAEYLHANTVNSVNTFFNITPGNLMLTSDNQVILLDYFYQHQTSLINDKKKNSLDALFYIAPEFFLKDNRIDIRSNIYSIGATLYSLVTQNDPAYPPHAIYPLRNRCPDLSLGLEYIINKCMEHNANKRYDTIASLRHDLKNVNALTKKLAFKNMLHTFIKKAKK